MKPFLKISWLLIAISLLGMSACGGPTPTVDTGLIYTQIASTALALQTLTAESMPTASNTLQPSPTLEATVTPLITNTPLSSTPPAPPKATSQASCDNSKLSADVTIPDGYVATPGEIMTKTWRIENLGPCTWDQDYSLTFAYGGEGTNWDTTRPAYLSFVVQPGQTAEVSVNLAAPTASGEYGAFFRLRNDKGVYFGTYVTIYIKVE
jgi:hypothetical protein